jgi:phosphate transport system substrate-binding protein
MKRLTAAAALAALAALVLLAPGCGNRKGGGEDKLNGGGSSFINPIMKKWAGLYFKAKQVQIDYSSTGSGNGIQQMIEKKNDFGCTDAPMNDEQLKKAKAEGGEVLHIPLVQGGVVPIYNLKGVAKPLRFTGPVLADIYLNKIKRWNDMRITSLNKGVDLPDQRIAVVHRSDGSGTTFIWSDYLSKVSDEWKEQVGSGTDLKWPTGVGQPKNDGVAKHVKDTPGAIGYVELTYALNSNLQFGSVKNRAGQFITASLESVTKAAEGAKIPDDMRYSLTDSSAKGAYPICGTTWAVLYKDQPAEKAKLLRDFLHWCVHEGQEQCAGLYYSRLSEGLVKRIDTMLEGVGPRK